MEFLQSAVDLILHLDKHLNDIIQSYGVWTHLILVAIVFCETGLVVTPFLPGDSLLFAAGAFSAVPENGLHIGWLVVLLSAAAILGDTVNYACGKLLANRVASGNLRLIKPAHLARTHAFYEKYGAKTIVLARFVPIVRTFAPFVAGVGSMSYATFITYNIVGGVAWCGLFLLAGYFFGNMPAVKENFTLVILAIIVLSVLPIVYELYKARSEARRARAEQAP
jgi:membrane-associated protein